MTMNPEMLQHLLQAQELRETVLMEQAAREGRIPSAQELAAGHADAQERLSASLLDTQGTALLEDRLDIPTDDGSGDYSNPGHLRRLESYGTEYQEDFRELAKGPGDLSSNVVEWEKRPPEEVAQSRLDFTMNKKELIAEWERDNGRLWPRYTEDAYDEKTGTKLRKEGDLYDAHHLRPLEFGGANKADNLAPFHVGDHYDHRGIHRPDGPLARLSELLRGV